MTKVFAEPLPDVDIVVPVFNALEYVQQCLESVIQCNDDLRLNLIIVDDASDDETARWLEAFCSSHACATLIRHADNLGYTQSANTGLRLCRADYCVLLNSDTMVTPGWLAGMLRCMKSAPNIGMVGPLSNAAGWQSVPELMDASGEYAINQIPPGLTSADMAQRLASTSQRRYPRVPALNGFCLLINARVPAHIGHFDETNFPLGYGEETDYCIRARAAGFELVIADDCYVFHNKSKSFGHERRRELSDAGDRALRAKHGGPKIDKLLLELGACFSLEQIRCDTRISLSHHDTHPELLKRKLNLKEKGRLAGGILFVLPVGAGGGGGHSVIQEAQAMLELGLHVRVAVIRSNLDRFRATYHDVPAVDRLFLGFSTPEHLYAMAWRFSVVIATLYSSVLLVREIGRLYPGILPAYYVQDYEPLFFDQGTADYDLALRSYEMVPHMILFAKTWWLVDTVCRLHPTVTPRACKVLPSLDHTVYHPRHTRSGHPLRIAAMIRPESPRRAAGRTLRVLHEIAKHLSSCEIHIFGCEKEDLSPREFATNFRHFNHGTLTRPAVGSLLGLCDVFVDLSDYQAFGRTALEAMACGCVPVVPKQGGTAEFAIRGHNAIVVDSFDEPNCIQQICALLQNTEQLRAMRSCALATATQYSSIRAAASEIHLFANAVVDDWHPSNRARRLIQIIVWIAQRVLHRLASTITRR